MTATPAQPTTEPLRRRFDRATGVVAVVLGLLLPIGAASPALAASTPTAETPTPSPTATPEHAGLQVSLLPDANGAYTSGAPLTATLAIRNDDVTALGPGTVRLELERDALPERAAVSAWLDGSGPNPLLSAIGDTRTAALGAGESSSPLIVVPTAGLGDLAPGVYPVRATFQAQTTASTPRTVTASSSSVLVVSGGVAPSVITIVPITATPKSELLSATELAALTTPTGALTTALDGVTGTPAVLAIDPSIPAAIRVLGANAPATATAWLARLEALPNDRFLLQFGDADVAAQAAAGLHDPLTVTDFDPFTNPSGTAPTTPTPTPSPSPTTGAPAPAKGSDLGAVAGAHDDILWPRGQVSSSEVATMATYGPTADAHALPILPSTTFAAGAKSAAVSPYGSVGSTPVLVTDTAVSDALSSAAVETDTARRDADLVEANAMLAFSAPGSTVLAGLARAEVRSDQGLTAAVTTFSGGQDGRLGRVLSTPPVDLTVATASAEDRADAVTTLNTDAAHLADFATILNRPADLTVRERISVMQLLGVGVHTTPDDFATALKAHRVATQETMGAVGIQPSNPILISAKVDVPVWVRNDLPYPVHVGLHITASDPRIEVPATTQVDAQPSSTTRVKIPVEAGVANAEVSLQMKLTSPTGVAIGPGQTARLTIRAEWETIGLIVFGALAVLLIGGGIFRTIRRRKAVAGKHAADGMEAENSEPDSSEAPGEDEGSVPAAKADEDPHE